MAQITATNEKESAVLNAALHVFAAKGKDGARMQEIADRADINKAMLHYYFRSKDKLYEAVLESVMLHFFDAMDAVFQKNLPFPDMLRELIGMFMQEHMEHPDVSRLWVHEQLSGGEISKALLGKNVNRGPQALMERIELAVSDGEIRPVSPVQFLMSFMGMTLFYFIASPTFSVFNKDMVTDPEKALEDRKKHIYDVLYNGLSI
jgi:TetR/AcrR family transcriptional regulator